MLRATAEKPCSLLAAHSTGRREQLSVVLFFPFFFFFSFRVSGKLISLPRSSDLDVKLEHPTESLGGLVKNRLLGSTQGIIDF